MAKMGGGEGNPRGNMVGILLIRFFLGGILLFNGLAHIISAKGFTTVFAHNMSATGVYVQKNEFPVFQQFLLDVVAPTATSVAWVIIALELVAGLLLLLGMLTRVGGFLTLLLATFFLLATYHLGEQYLFMRSGEIVMALAVMVAAAGRTFGIDALLAPRMKWKFLC